MNWNKILQGRQNEYPSELLIRFVARNYYDLPFHEQITFLDIGSGAGANAMFLASKGFHVITVDKAITAHAQHQRDINECEFGEKQFDCIVDFNTLCHVKNPPMEKIKRWLKVGGKFFSVAPTSSTWKQHLEGKGYCRCATKDQIEYLYRDFPKLQIGKASYPDRGHTISSWVIEATK